MQEEVILVDEFDKPMGVMEKMEAHRKALLHRAFSVFIFNMRGEMLLQRRAMSKYHSGGLWTNACCSHPRPHEDTGQAARRRLFEELGFAVSLKKVFDFTYRSEFENGLTEHEFDHVYVGYHDQEVYPNAEEVSEYRWMGLAALQADLEVHPSAYTSWFHLALPMVRSWLERNAGGAESKRDLP